MHDILISYSSKDKIIADAVCNQMESNGIRVWIAPRDILAGESYPNAIINGIVNCSIVVLIFTKNSNESQWVPREIERGINYGKIILPFKIEEVIPISGDIEMCTCTDHWLDALTPPLEAHIASLIDTVKKLLGKVPGGIDNALKANYSKLSPLGQFYQLAARWQKNNYAYFVLESLNEEQKSILRNSPKSIEFKDDNLMLFMLEASLHFGGDWIYWARKIKNEDLLIKHLVKMLTITYIRPRYRSLYLLQECDKNITVKWLKHFNLYANKQIISVFNKHIWNKQFHPYLQKIANNNDSEVSKRAKTVLFEIERYDNALPGLDVFPEM